RVITDAQGKASFKVKIPDIESVSQWQVSALAHTINGKMGTGDCKFKVFQGLRVDMDLPPLLTEGDEISIPVVIHNYYGSPQEITLLLQHDSWFDLSGNTTRKTRINANGRKVEYFKIRARGAGNHRMTLRTSSRVQNDTFVNELAVIPLGKEIQQGFNYRLKGGEEIRKRIVVPETAIHGRDKLMVKIYPGFLSQMVDGMESMLRFPHGCFEQSSSITYPNIMVLEYMKKTGQETPAIKEKAEHYLSKGYQKLLQHERRDGDLSFFIGYAQKVSLLFKGQDQKIFTAYGLLLFSDMQKVYPIAGEIIPRVQKWLLSQMEDDHWDSDSPFGAASYAKNNAFTATAYITWALLHSGIDKDDKQIQTALDYLEKYHTSYFNNPNALGYCALSLIEAQRQVLPVIQRLNELAKNDQYGIYWAADPFGTGGSAVSAANVETTAIAALANLEANNQSLDVFQILHYLLMNKKTSGTWGSTQATVLTLKVLTRALPESSEAVFGMANVWLNNEPVQDILFTENNNIIMHVVDLKDFVGTGLPEIQIKFKGRGELFCQLLSSYYLRWDDPLIYQRKSPINLDLTYDNRRFNKGEILTVDVTASYTDKRNVNFAIVDIGIPPGFKAIPGDFREIKAKGIIDRFEINRGRIVLYLNDLDQKGKRFRFGLRAITEARVKMPGARIYEYYNPQMIEEVQPDEFTVI
ncbi:MAG: hypothetical protein JSV88_13385, partial [Candidatus Aminicenantes bacterium]